jgi:hypothetical protein
MPFPYPIMQILHNVAKPYAAGFPDDAFNNSSPTASHSARINACRGSSPGAASLSR